MPSLWCHPEQKERGDLETQDWLAFNSCSEDQELLKNKEGTEPVWYASVGIPVAAPKQLNLSGLGLQFKIGEGDPQLLQRGLVEILEESQNHTWDFVSKFTELIE